MGYSDIFSASMLIFLIASTLPTALAKKVDIADLILASVFSIKSDIMFGFYKIIVYSPVEQESIIELNIISSSLKHGDLSQKPNVSSWQSGSKSSCFPCDFCSKSAKNLVKDSDERHFSIKWIVLS